MAKVLFEAMFSQAAQSQFDDRATEEIRISSIRPSMGSVKKSEIRPLAKDFRVPELVALVRVLPFLINRWVVPSQVPAT